MAAKVALILFGLHRIEADMLALLRSD